MANGIWELGKKVVWSIAPVSIFAGFLAYLKERAILEWDWETIIILVLISALAYIILWHELRIRGLEKKPKKSKKKKLKKKKLIKLL